MGQDTEELKHDIEDTRSDMTETLDAIGDRMSPEPDRAASQESHDGLGAQLPGADTRDGHSERRPARFERRRCRYHRRHQAHPRCHRQQYQGAPLVAGAIAFGAGFLVAAVFSPTETEKRASAKVMETLEPAKEQLMDSAKEVADHLKEPVKEAAPGHQGRRWRQRGDDQVGCTRCRRRHQVSSERLGTGGARGRHGQRHDRPMTSQLTSAVDTQQESRLNMGAAGKPCDRHEPHPTESGPR